MGHRGDYYTSVSVGPLFGELLARQFSQWLSQIDQSREEPSAPVAGDGFGAKLHLVEAGAHDGTLARDILRWLDRNEPALADKVHYWLVEPADWRQALQRKTLHEFSHRVSWIGSLDEFPVVPNPPGQNRPGVRGVIFSNELLDAMPVHRLGWDKLKFRWFEWGVTFREGRFEWVRLPDREANSQHLFQPDPFGVTAQRWPQELWDALPDGFTLEVCPAASRWWKQAGVLLGRGKLVALDYGLEDLEWLSPARRSGTLRAYYRHHLNADALSRPGEQDLTAHVNFSALIRAGESAGLKTDAVLSQEQFLTRIAGPLLERKTQVGDWTAEDTRQFQTLTHPGQLGHSFRVLVQSRL